MKPFSWSAPLALHKKILQSPVLDAPVTVDDPCVRAVRSGLPGGIVFTFIIWPDGLERTVYRLEAKKFKDLLAAGESLTDAAGAVTLVPSQISEARAEIGRSVQGTLDNFGWVTNKNLRRAFIRASVHEIAHKAMTEFEATKDPKFLKLGLDAIRAMGEDSEIEVWGKKTEAAKPVEADLIPIPEDLKSLLAEHEEKKEEEK